MSYRAASTPTPPRARERRKYRLSFRPRWIDADVALLERVAAFESPMQAIEAMEASDLIPHSWAENTTRSFVPESAEVDDGPVTLPGSAVGVPRREIVARANLAGLAALSKSFGAGGVLALLGGVALLGGYAASVTARNNSVTNRSPRSQNSRFALGALGAITAMATGDADLWAAAAGLPTSPKPRSSTLTPASAREVVTVAALGLHDVARLEELAREFSYRARPEGKAHVVWQIVPASRLDGAWTGMGSVGRSVDRDLFNGWVAQLEAKGFRRPADDRPRWLMPKTIARCADAWDRLASASTKGNVEAAGQILTADPSVPLGPNPFAPLHDIWSMGCAVSSVTNEYVTILVPAWKAPKVKP